MFKKVSMMAAATLALAGTVYAQEGAVPTGIPHLDHVFVIMMENHGFSQVIGNPNDPFVNKYAKSANLATNYYAIAHPSLNNYLEVVGGSNFGIHSDNYPSWYNNQCRPNLETGVPNTDNPPSPTICPVAGTGTDAAVPAIDYTNEFSGKPGTINIDGTASIPANPKTVGKTIADQLAATGRTYKSYQESIPVTGVSQVNYSDGVFTNRTDFSKILPAQTPPLASSDIVALYAAKHNPFVYFRSTQEGWDSLNTLRNTVGFDRLYADLATGDVPAYSFIVPNQCHDQHGRGNAGAFCNYDPNDDGTQAGLNPALMYQGDLAVEKLVTAIHNSPAWHEGKSAIITVWDENDYSSAPYTNQVAAIVDTNYGVKGVQSQVRYTHFSLLKSVEAGLGLPCLNHACDSSTAVMADMFKAK